MADLCSHALAPIHTPAPPSRLSQDPAAFFAHPQYKATGNLFWPDAWQGLVADRAYGMHGVLPYPGRVRGVYCCLAEEWRGSGVGFGCLSPSQQW